MKLPANAAGSFEVTDQASGATIAVRLIGAAPALGERAEAGTVLYPGAVAGADWIHRAQSEGTEDFVVFDAKPVVEELVFDVALPPHARVRHVADTVEILDETGKPVLRMSPPFAVDASGDEVAMATRVDACVVDRDPRAPWGRAMAEAGGHCRITVGWTSGAYPVLVDPAWTTTGSMAARYDRPAGAPLPGGRFLIRGVRPTKASTCSVAFVATNERRNRARGA